MYTFTILSYDDTSLTAARIAASDATKAAAALAALATTIENLATRTMQTSVDFHRTVTPTEVLWIDKVMDSIRPDLALAIGRAWRESLIIADAARQQLATVATLAGRAFEITRNINFDSAAIPAGEQAAQALEEAATDIVRIYFAAAAIAATNNRKEAANKRPDPVTEDDIAISG